MTSAVVRFLVGHLLWVLAIYGVFWLLGWGKKSSRRHRAAHPIVGMFLTLAAVTWLWKNRRDVGRTVGGLIIAATVAGWGIAIWLHPQLGLRLLLPAGIVACLVVFAPGDVLWPGQTGGLLYRRIGNRPITAAIAEWVTSGKARDAVILDERVRPGRARVRGRVIDVPVHVGDGSDLDPAHIGARAVARNLDVRSVRVIPSDRPGRAVVRLSPDAPPSPSPWPDLDRIFPWPGPSSTRADDPVPVAVDRFGRVLSIPGPSPEDVEHVGIAGATRRGKSSMFVTIIGEFAHRPNVALILLDPVRVEFAPWAPRATKVYRGKDACQAGVLELVALLDRRSDRVDALGRRTAPFGEDWPRIVICVDEVAAMVDKAQDKTSQALARLAEGGGKFGMQLFVATQRPEVGVWEGRLRDNLLTRLGFKHSSGEGSRMTTGPDGPDLTAIPKTIKGALMMWHDMEWTAARGFLVQPKGEVPADERSEALGYAAAEIAQATAHLQVPWERL